MGEIEFPNGEMVEVPRADKVFPVLGEVDDVLLNVTVEDGKVNMSERDLETELSVATSHKDVDDLSVTIFSGISSIHEDDSYAEIKFDNLSQVEDLVNALGLVLEYHQED